MKRFLALALCLLPVVVHADSLPTGFVRMSDVAPAIASDIRYARTFNFTGAIVPGYEAAECIVTNGTGQALLRAEEALNADGYGLILFDCYRPVRAVESFMGWAEAGDRTAEDDVFLPGLARADLVPGGYIATQSSHSLGVAVDVGLRRLSDPPMRAEMARGLRCDGPFGVRPQESTLDMGTSFDCFSPLSGAVAEVSDAAMRNRARLLQAMESAGFVGYAAEWWHFRYAAEPPARAMDFPVH